MTGGTLHKTWHDSICICVLNSTNLEWHMYWPLSHQQSPANQTYYAPHPRIHSGQFHYQRHSSDTHTSQWIQRGSLRQQAEMLILAAWWDFELSWCVYSHCQPGSLVAFGHRWSTSWHAQRNLSECIGVCRQLFEMLMWRYVWWAWCLMSTVGLS